jgi:hypothetical protein
MSGNLPWDFEKLGDELRDDEYPDADSDEADWDDESSETVSCAQCGAEIYEDAFQCPACGAHVSGDSGANPVWTGRPGWWIVLGLLGILAVIAMLVLTSN